MHKKFLIVTAVAGCLIFIIDLILPRIKESFSIILDKNLMSVDPEATGVQRPLWGPVYKKDPKYNRHSEMKYLPHPLGLLDGSLSGMHLKREMLDARYEDDKI
jgi:hypothetical protein